MSDHPVVRHNLPPEAFPLHIEALLPNGVLVWSVRVPGPAHINVPPLKQRYGQPISLRITYGDGSVDFHEPPP